MSMDGRYSAKSQEGGAVMSMDGRADICSCNISTSTIHGGRMSRRARKAARLCPWMDGLKTAPRQLLLRCPTTVLPVHMHCPNIVRPVHMRCLTKLHSCNDAFPALPTSMWVVFWSDVFYLPTFHVGLISEVMILFLRSHSKASSASCSNQACADPSRKE